MSHIDTFEDLECYKAGREFRNSISRWTRTLPKVEEYRLKDQIIRSSRSVTANIAEGFGRHHPQENLQFCRQSRGSLMETLEHLNTAFDEDLLGEEEYQTFRQQWNEVRALLGGYISYLQKLAPKDKRFN
jgi:four helix bundle protein